MLKYKSVRKKRKAQKLFTIHSYFLLEYAGVAELADALDSGSNECKFMWVQVPFSAPR